MSEKPDNNDRGRLWMDRIAKWGPLVFGAGRFILDAVSHFLGH
jgi:hypothetical protein